MLEMLLAFAPIAALVTLAPGAATALVVRSALHGGVREGLAVIAGNSIGVVAWALASVAGLSAVVAASETAFATLKVAGALVLVTLGLQSLLRARRPAPAAAALVHRDGLTAGLASSLSNPKLALLYVAILPQFVPAGAAILPATLLMAGLVVVLDVVWFTTIAVTVERAQALVDDARFAIWAQRVSGVVLAVLGVTLALSAAG